jgi:hypothetical protein
MFSQAVRHLEVSVSRDQSDATVYYHLGMAYVRMATSRRASRPAEGPVDESAVDGIDEARKTLAEATRK